MLTALRSTNDISRAVKATGIRDQPYDPTARTMRCPPLTRLQDIERLHNGLRSLKAIHADAMAGDVIGKDGGQEPFRIENQAARSREVPACRPLGRPWSRPVPISSSGPTPPKVLVFRAVGGSNAYPARAYSTPQAAKDLAVRLRDHNRIPVSDIARACGVSRQAVYGWIAGQLAGDAFLHRLNALARATGRLIAAAESDDGAVVPAAKALRRPITDGASLLDIIARNENPDTALRSLLSILDREAAEHRCLVARLSKGRRREAMRSADDPINDIGAPAYDEG